MNANIEMVMDIAPKAMYSGVFMDYIIVAMWLNAGFRLDTWTIFL
jgi:hypothetical protein